MLKTGRKDETTRVSTDGWSEKVDVKHLDAQHLQGVAAKYKCLEKDLLHVTPVTDKIAMFSSHYLERRCEIKAGDTCL